MGAAITLIIIAVFVLFCITGLLYWYAYRHEVTNFKLVDNIINLKSKIKI
ncbi:MAG: hypothetical protein ACYCXK_04065 [Candidatus Humimicrobiaceae bacterium]